jgi:hypothetical protein
MIHLKFVVLSSLFYEYTYNYNDDTIETNGYIIEMKIRKLRSFTKFNKAENSYFFINESILYRLMGLYILRNGGAFFWE